MLEQQHICLCIERGATCGSCAGMFTANSMNCLTEAIGMGLPGNGTIPAVMAARTRLAKEAGMKVMTLLKKKLTPQKIMTEKAKELGCEIMATVGDDGSVARGPHPVFFKCGFHL